LAWNLRRCAGDTRGRCRGGLAGLARLRRIEFLRLLLLLRRLLR